jgi:hypothetical protein
MAQGIAPAAIITSRDIISIVITAGISCAQIASPGRWPRQISPTPMRA